MKSDRFLLALCIAVFLHSPKSLAQQSATETCDVPVVVTNYSNQLVRNLATTDFTVRLGDALVPVSGAAIDGGPKRIALILDASGNVPDDEWALETDMALSFVGNARPKDQFSFFTIGAEYPDASFLSSEELTERLQKLTGARTNEKIYDALMVAVNRLSPPQFGDAIFLFGHHEDVGSVATFDQIRELILKNKLRFYGMSFADPLRKLPPGFDLNKPTGLRLSRLESLSAETGYFFSLHAVHNVNQPGQMSLLKEFLADLYAGIAEPYRLSIPASAIKDQTRAAFAVSNLEKLRVHKDGIHYPHSIYPCAVTEKAP